LEILREKKIAIVAAQNQAIITNYLKNTISKEETDIKCQLCKQEEEIIDHRVLHFGEE
jgi:hypothetical protein